MLAVLAADNLADNAMGIDHQFIYGNSLIDAVTLQLGSPETTNRIRSALRGDQRRTIARAGPTCAS